MMCGTLWPSESRRVLRKIGYAFGPSTSLDNGRVLPSTDWLAWLTRTQFGSLVAWSAPLCCSSRPQMKALVSFFSPPHFHIPLVQTTVQALRLSRRRRGGGWVMLQYFAGYFRVLPCVVVAIQRNSMSHFKNSKKHVAIHKETLSLSD